MFGWCVVEGPGSGIFTHSVFINSNKLQKAFFMQITLSEEAIINGTCLKEEFHKLSEIKSGTASNLITDYQKHCVCPDSWGTGGW